MAPATQTTVITTTTTTTMSYPPFVMNAPRNLSERDSKEYPLAHTQAPESIRRFFFDAGGTQACFEEANDVVDKMQQVRLTELWGLAFHKDPRGLGRELWSSVL